MSSDPPRRRRTDRGRGANRRRRQRSLGLDAILDVTLDIIDRDGVDAVSMRRVANEFDTGAASLYAYVDSKDALLRLALDRVIDQIEVPPTGDWQQLVRGFVANVRSTFAAHADIAKLSFAHIPTSSGTVINAERLLASMIGAGVPPQVAAWSLDIVALYVAADVYEGYLLGQRFADPAGRPAEEVGAEHFTAEVSEAFGQLPAEQFPYLTRYAAQLIGGSGDERFEFGIDMLIAGFAAQIPTSRRRTRTRAPSGPTRGPDSVTG